MMEERLPMHLSRFPRRGIVGGTDGRPASREPTYKDECYCCGELVSPLFISYNNEATLTLGKNPERQ
jgi:hypothetical protein